MASALTGGRLFPGCSSPKLLQELHQEKEGKQKAHAWVVPLLKFTFCNSAWRVSERRVFQHVRVSLQPALKVTHVAGPQNCIRIDDPTYATTSGDLSFSCHRNSGVQ